MTDLLKYTWEAKFIPTHPTQNDFSIFTATLEEMTLDAVKKDAKLIIHQVSDVDEVKIVTELGSFVTTSHQFDTYLEMVNASTREVIQAWNVLTCTPYEYNYDYDIKSLFIKQYTLKFNYQSIAAIQQLTAEERWDRAMKGL